MRNRWIALWLCVWAAMFGCAVLVAGCGGGHHHKGAPKVSRSAPTTVTDGRQSAMGSVAPPGWGHPPPGTKVHPKAVRPSALPPTADQFDTILVSTVPRNSPYVAGYTSGFWPTYFALLKLPWHPHVVSIAVNASHHAMCLDIEPGDATPSQAASWYFAVKNDPGMRGQLVDGKPCEYSSFWEFVNQIIPVLNAHHIARSDIWEWDANFTMVRHLDQGFDCTQFTDKALGLNLDESMCTLAFLGVHPRPTPPPPPPAPRHPYPAKLMTGTENAVLASWYSNRCKVPARRGVCVHDAQQAQQLAHNIWVARQKDGKPWDYRNRGIRFHVLTLIDTIAR